MSNYTFSRSQSHNTDELWWYDQMTSELVFKHLSDHRSTDFGDYKPRAKKILGHGRCLGNILNISQNSPQKPFFLNVFYLQMIHSLIIMTVKNKSSERK